MRSTVLRLSLLGVILIAFSLRIWQLDHQELRGDEAFGYFFSLRSFGAIIEDTIELQEPHPVASYFVQKIWMTWAGDSEFALRFVSAWFGLLAVVLLYRFALNLTFAQTTSLLATTLFAISPYAIWHSQDARMYSMSLALTLTSTGLAVEWLRSRQRPIALGYIATSWLALHTHYFAAFVLVAQNIFVVCKRSNRLLLLKWLVLQLIVSLLYIPWLLQVGSTLTRYEGNGDSPAFVEMLQRSLSVFVIGETTSLVIRTTAGVLAAALLLIGAIQLVHPRSVRRQALWLLWLYLFTPLLITWASATQRPIFNERYLIAAVPPFYLLLAVAICKMKSLFPQYLHNKSWPQALPVGLSMLICSGMIFSLNNYYTDASYSKTVGWRKLARTLERLSAEMPTEQARFAQNFPDPTLWYYYRGNVEHVVLPPLPHDMTAAKQEVDRFVSQDVQRVILPLQAAPNWDNTEIASQVLGERYRLVAQIEVANWPIQLFERPPQTLDPIHLPFQNGIQLALFALNPQSLVPGGVLAVHLAWKAESAVLTGSEKVFVHLSNRDGHLVSQDDRPLALQNTPLSDHPSVRSYGILLSGDIVSGNYRLLVGLYDPSLDGAPRILTMDGMDHVQIATLSVTNP